MSDVQQFQNKQKTENIKVNASAKTSAAVRKVGMEDSLSKKKKVFKMPENYENFSKQAQALIDDWKFMAFSSDLMKDVKEKLTELGNVMDEPVPINDTLFDSYLDQHKAMYEKVLFSCNTYLENRKNPWTSRGKRRYELVENTRDIIQKEYERFTMRWDEIREFAKSKEEPISWGEAMFEANTLKSVDDSAKYDVIEANESNVQEIRMRVAASRLARSLNIKGLYEETELVQQKMGEPQKLLVKKRDQDWVDYNSIDKENTYYDIAVVKKLQTMKVIDFLLGIEPSYRQKNLLIKTRVDENGKTVITDVMAINNKTTALENKNEKTTVNMTLKAFDISIVDALYEASPLFRRNGATRGLLYRSSESVNPESDHGMMKLNKDGSSEADVVESKYEILNQNIVFGAGVKQIKSDDQWRVTLYNYKKSYLESQKENKGQPSNQDFDYIDPKMIYMEEQEVESIKKEQTKPTLIIPEYETIEKKSDVPDEVFNKIKEFSKNIYELAGKFKSDKTTDGLPTVLVEMNNAALKLLKQAAESSIDSTQQALGSTLLKNIIIFRSDFESRVSTTLKSQGIEESSVDKLDKLGGEMIKFINSYIFKNSEGQMGELTDIPEGITKDLEFESNIEKDMKKNIEQRVKQSRKVDEITTKILDMKDMPLFGSGIKPEDVKQGMIADCYLLSTLAAVASKDPDHIRKHMKDNGDGTVTVKLYNEGEPKYVRVEKTVAVCKSKKGIDTEYDFYGSDLQDGLWVYIYEKAYSLALFGDNGASAEDDIEEENVEKKSENKKRKKKKDMSSINFGRTSDAMAHITGLNYVKKDIKVQCGDKLEQLNYSDLIDDYKIEEKYRPIKTVITNFINEELATRYHRLKDENTGFASYDGYMSIEDVADTIRAFKTWKRGEYYKLALTTMHGLDVDTTEENVDAILEKLAMYAIEKNQSNFSSKEKKTVHLEHRSVPLSQKIENQNEYYSANARHCFDSLNSLLNKNRTRIIGAGSRRLHFTGKTIGSGLNGEFESNGIVERHSYTIVGVTNDENSGHLVVHLRNPWAKKGMEYKKVKDADGKDTFVPQYNDESNQGYFDMDINDFMKYFAHVAVVDDRQRKKVKRSSRKN